MKKRVAILGCGPAGLLCAWAVEQAGLEPVIYSRKEKSQIPGSQHLHGPVPGITSLYPEGTIQFVRLGTAEGYAEKVYGDRNRQTGWDNYLQIYPSWNVIKAYDKLWAHFDASVYDANIDTKYVEDLVQMYGLGRIISTLPADVLCYRQDSHKFRGVPYYIRRLPTPPADSEHEIVVYNGLPDDPWYRWSILGGLCSIEYCQPPHPNEENGWREEGWTTGQKAIDNNCDCWEGAVHRCGRWAEWRHGVTMYLAFKKAEEIATQIVREQ